MGGGAIPNNNTSLPVQISWARHWTRNSYGTMAPFYQREKIRARIISSFAYEDR